MTLPLVLTVIHCTALRAVWSGFGILVGRYNSDGHTLYSATTGSRLGQKFKYMCFMFHFVGRELFFFTLYALASY